MAVAFDTLKAGDRLFDVHSERAGNTTMRRMGIWPVRVVEVDTANRKALVRWNGNTAEWKRESYFGDAKIRRWPPEWVRRSPGLAGEYCYLCGLDRSLGHSTDCEHPKAVAARKKSVSK